LEMEDLNTPGELIQSSGEINITSPSIRLTAEYRDREILYKYSFQSYDGIPEKSMALGFAAGGRISQKIIRDRLPPTAYDQDNGKRLHVTVLNSAYFTAVTGHSPPTSPINAKTYQKLGLPWFTLFDEKIPGFVNASSLSGIQSISALDSSRKLGGQVTETQIACTYCEYEMATIRLLPCSHVVCDDCAAGLSEHSCPSCDNFVVSRERFAAPMPLPGNEAEDGVDAISLDDLVVGLERCLARGKTATFRKSADKVSELSSAK